MNTVDTFVKFSFSYNFYKIKNYYKKNSYYFFQNNENDKLEINNSGNLVFDVYNKEKTLNANTLKYSIPLFASIYSYIDFKKWKLNNSLLCFENSYPLRYFLIPASLFVICYNFKISIYDNYDVPKTLFKDIFPNYHNTYVYDIYQKKSGIFENSDDKTK